MARLLFFDVKLTVPVRAIFIGLLILAITLHLLTPGWMLGDFHELADGLSMTLVFVNVALCVLPYRQEDVVPRQFKVLSWTVVVSCVTYFLTTVFHSEELDYYLLRITEILKYDYYPTASIAEWVGGLNFISLIIFLIVEIVLSSIMFGTIIGRLRQPN